MTKEIKYQQQYNVDEYHKYMESPEWRERKRVAYSIHGKSCQRCGLDDKALLTVHHKTYERMGRENVTTDLAILCETCHNLYHQVHPFVSIQTTDAFILNKAGPFFVPRKKKEKKQLGREYRKPKKYTEISDRFYIAGEERKRKNKSKEQHKRKFGKRNTFFE